MLGEPCYKPSEGSFMICYPDKCKRRGVCAEMLWYTPHITPCSKIKDGMPLAFIYDIDSLSSLQSECLMISLGRDRVTEHILD